MMLIFQFNFVSGGGGFGGGGLGHGGGGNYGGGHQGKLIIFLQNFDNLLIGWKKCDRSDNIQFDFYFDVVSATL